MKIRFDDCTDLDSWVHRWDARFKIIGLVGLMMAFATVKSLWLLPSMILIVGLLYRFASLPFSFLKERLRYPGLFLVGIVLFIPWLSGHTPIWQWGPIILWKEGLLASLLISVRFLCSVTIGFIVLGTTPFLTLVKAMRSLGVPVILTDMMLLSYRYLFEILANLDRMRRAMSLRGFCAKPSFHPKTPSTSREVGAQRSLGNQITILATLAGTLFIRSYEQAERVYHAMRLRGYGYRTHPAPSNSAFIFSTGRPSAEHPSAYLWDTIALMLALGLSASILGANYWLGQSSP